MLRPKIALRWAAASANSFASPPGANPTAAAVGVVIDGCPPRLELSEADIQRELDRRRPGQSAIVTPRDEADRCRDSLRRLRRPNARHADLHRRHEQGCAARSVSEMETAFRPSHADFTYEAKYGIRNWQGGGRASARETIGRVAAGAVAKKGAGASSPGSRSWPTSTHIHELDAQSRSETVTFDASGGQRGPLPRRSVAART